MKAPPPRKPARAKARPLDGSERAWKRETAGGRVEEVTHLGVGGGREILGDRL